MKPAGEGSRANAPYQAVPLERVESRSGACAGLFARVARAQTHATMQRKRRSGMPTMAPMDMAMMFGFFRVGAGVEVGIEPPEGGWSHAKENTDTCREECRIDPLDGQPRTALSYGFDNL